MKLFGETPIKLLISFLLVTINSQPLEKQISTPEDDSTKQLSSTNTKAKSTSHRIERYGPLKSGPNNNQNIKKEDQNQLEFVDFTVQINSQNDENGVAPKEFTDLNKCVGFFSAETVLCVSSLLIMFLISAFSAWMIGGITTMDKFEDPSVRPLHVPLDAK